MKIFPRFSEAGKGAAWGIFSAALLIAAIAFRHPLEETMARHMLAQIPMLIAAGAAFNGFLTHTPLRRAFARHLAQWDEYGLTGLFAFLLVTAYWMIPKALDSAVASGTTEQAKMLSLFLAGLVLPASLSRTNVIIQLFFLGNFASMTAIVGMLYQDAPSRLCNSYLIDDQAVAGTGLVILAIVLPLLWGLSQESIRNYFKADAASAPSKIGHHPL